MFLYFLALVPLPLPLSFLPPSLCNTNAAPAKPWPVHICYWILRSLVLKSLSRPSPISDIFSRIYDSQ